MLKSKKSLIATPERPSERGVAGCRTLRPSTISTSGRRITASTPGTMS
jgi:hypothetical protein